MNDLQNDFCKSLKIILLPKLYFVSEIAFHIFVVEFYFQIETSTLHTNVQLIGLTFATSIKYHQTGQFQVYRCIVFMRRSKVRLG